MKKLSFLMLLFIAGCVKSNYKTLNQEFEDTGLIIIKLPKKLKIVSIVNIETSWDTVLSICQKNGECFNLYDTTEYKVLKLKAGYYYIDKIIEGKGGFDKKLNKPNFGGFYLGSNEIIYLGDITEIEVKDKVLFIKTIFQLCIKDNISEAKAYIQKTLPLIDTSKIQTRLLELGTNAEMKCE